MSATWRVAVGESQDSQDDKSTEHETTLVNTNGSPKCYGCGKAGHMQRDCPEKKWTGRYNGKCRECGGNGHKLEDFWEHEQNSKTGPHYWKSKRQRKETAGADIEHKILVGYIEGARFQRKALATKLNPRKNACWQPSELRKNA